MPGDLLQLFLVEMSASSRSNSALLLRPLNAGATAASSNGRGESASITASSIPPIGVANVVMALREVETTPGATLLKTKSIFEELQAVNEVVQDDSARLRSMINNATTAAERPRAVASQMSTVTAPTQQRSSYPLGSADAASLSRFASSGADGAPSYSAARTSSARAAAGSSYASSVVADLDRYLTAPVPPNVQQHSDFAQSAVGNDMENIDGPGSFIYGNSFVGNSSSTSSPPRSHYQDGRQTAAAAFAPQGLGESNSGSRSARTSDDRYYGVADNSSGDGGRLAVAALTSSHSASSPSASASFAQHHQRQAVDRDHRTQAASAPTSSLAAVAATLSELQAERERRTAAESKAAELRRVIAERKAQAEQAHSKLLARQQQQQQQQAQDERQHSRGTVSTVAATEPPSHAAPEPSAQAHLQASAAGSAHRQTTAAASPVASTPAASAAVPRPQLSSVSPPSPARTHPSLDVSGAAGPTVVEPSTGNTSLAFATNSFVPGPAGPARPSSASSSSSPSTEIVLSSATSAGGSQFHQLAIATRLPEQSLTLPHIGAQAAQVENSCLKSELDRLRNQLQKHQDESAMILSRKDAASSEAVLRLEAHVSALGRQLTAAQAEAGSTSAIAEERLSRINSLTVRLQSARNEADAADEERRKVKAVLLKVETDLNTAQAKLKVSEEANAKLRKEAYDMSSEIMRLKRVEEMATKGVAAGVDGKLLKSPAQLEKELSLADKRMLELEEENSMLRSSKDALMATMRAADVNLEQLSAALTSAEEREATARKDLADAQASKARAVAELTARALAAESEGIGMRSRLEAALSQAADSNARADAIAAQMAIMETQWKESQRLIGALSAEVDTCNSRIDSLNGQILEMAGENESLRRALTDSKQRVVDEAALARGLNSAAARPSTSATAAAVSPSTGTKTQPTAKPSTTSIAPAVAAVPRPSELTPQVELGSSEAATSAPESEEWNLPDTEQLAMAQKLPVTTLFAKPAAASQTAKLAIAHAAPGNASAPGVIVVSPPPPLPLSAIAPRKHLSSFHGGLTMTTHKTTAPVRKANHLRVYAALSSVMLAGQQFTDKLKAVKRVMESQSDKQVVIALVTSGNRSAGQFAGLYAVLEDAESGMQAAIAAATASLSPSSPGRQSSRGAAGDHSGRSPGSPQSFKARDSGDSQASPSHSIQSQIQLQAQIKLAVRIYGTGPQFISPPMVNTLFKFDTATREFREIGSSLLHTGSITATTDAVGIDPSWVVVVRKDDGSVALMGRDSKGGGAGAVHVSAGPASETSRQKERLMDQDGAGAVDGVAAVHRDSE